MSEKVEDLLRCAERDKNESSINSAEKIFSSEKESERIFSLLKSKLLNIDEWNEHSSMSSFQTFDENGHNLKIKSMAIGDFIQVSLKGSGKYDWIKVIGIYETADEFVITVQPTYDPTEEIIDETVISHFFTDDSTNNFCLLRNGVKIMFFIIGLNEKQNTSETKNALESIRNIAVNLSTYLGIQNGEWKTFCQNFLENASTENPQ